MSTAKLTDTQWKRILEFLRQDQRAYVEKESRCRRFVEAVIRISRSGAQWHFLREEYGNWNSIYKRFARWSDAALGAEVRRATGTSADFPVTALQSIRNASSRRNIKFHQRATAEARHLLQSYTQSFSDVPRASRTGRVPSEARIFLVTP